MVEEHPTRLSLVMMASFMATEWTARELFRLAGEGLELQSQLKVQVPRSCGLLETADLCQIT